MSQDAMRLTWPAEEVDSRLKSIMGSIHRVTAAAAANAAAATIVRPAGLPVPRTAAPVPSTASAQARVSVAMPDSRQSRFRAVRSPVSSARAGPSIVQRVWSGTTRAPSGTFQRTLTRASTAWNTALNQGAPHSTACSRLMTVASARLPAGIRAAVTSPSPRSSCRARSTVS